MYLTCLSVLVEVQEQFSWLEDAGMESIVERIRCELYYTITPNIQQTIYICL